jgi:hypothetical protein
MTFRYASSAFSGGIVSSAVTNVVGFPNGSRRILLSAPVSKWRETVERRLNELIRLECGWDGYQGAPVSFENAYFAMQLLEASCGQNAPIPQIIPGTAGDLQIEWHLQHGDIELDVLAPNNVNAWRRTPTTGFDGEEITLTNDFSAVARWIEELTEPPRASGTAAA